MDRLISEMKKEERSKAIEYLKSYRILDENLHNIAPLDSVSYYATDICLKYWDMAIKALEQEPKYCDRNICLKNEYNNIGCDECEVTKSQEPCEDAISRSGAIKAIEERAKRIKNGDTLNGLAGAVGILFELPSVKPQEPKWIPVSERLPDKDGEYLLWGRVTEDEEVYYSFIGDFDSGCEEFGIWEEQYDRSTLGCLGSEFFEYDKVIAWMPLPKPYEPQESEDKE